MNTQNLRFVILGILSLMLLAPVHGHAALEEQAPLSLSADYTFNENMTASFGVSDEAVLGSSETEPSYGVGGKLSYETGEQAKLTFSYKNDLGFNVFEGVKPSHTVGINFNAKF